MKKLIKLYIQAACAVIGILIFLKLILPPFGLGIKYTAVMSAVLLVAVSIGAITSAVLYGLGECERGGAVMMFPLTAAFGIILSFDSDGGWWIPLLATSVSAVVFAFGKTSFSGKLLCGVLALVLSVPLFFLSVGNLVFGDFAKTTVMARAESPYSDMSAELIEIDGGALGVDYRIDVRKNGTDADLGIARISSHRKQIIAEDYYGADVRMYFKDGDTIVVNGDEYDVR